VRGILAKQFRQHGRASPMSLLKTPIAPTSSDRLPIPRWILRLLIGAQ
jgi:hypothetical protein